VVEGERERRDTEWEVTASFCPVEDALEPGEVP